MERLSRPWRQQGSEGGRASVQTGEGFGSSSLSSSSAEGSDEGEPLGGRRHSRSWTDVRNLGGSRREEGVWGEEVPCPRPRQMQRRAPGGLGRVSVGSEHLRKARSMEVIAVEMSAAQGRPPGGQPTPLGGAVDRGSPGSKGGAQLGKDKERLVLQKVKFSQFLDEITARVLSPAELSALNQKVELASEAGPRGNGQARARFRHGTEGRSWQEREPAASSGQAGGCRAPSDPPGHRGEDDAAPGWPDPQPGARPPSPRSWQAARPSVGTRQGRGASPAKYGELSSRVGRTVRSSKPSSSRLTDSSSSPDEPPSVAGVTYHTGVATSKEPLTDPHRTKSPSEENWGVPLCLACVSRRTAGRGSESSSSHGYLEALHQVRVELDHLRKLLSRREQDGLRTHEAIESLEQKLNRTVADMEVERNTLNQSISDLTTRLTRAQWAISAQQNITEQAPQHGHNAGERSLKAQGPWEGRLLSPPAPFVDEGGDWPLLSEAADAAGVSQAAGQPSSEGRANHEEAGWLLMERPSPTTAFTPWNTHAEDPGPLDWFGRPEGQEPHVDGRKEQAGGPGDPFEPLAPEGNPVASLGEGGRREAGSGRQQESLGPRPCRLVCDPWGRPEPEAGCCGEAQVEGESRPEPGLPGVFRHRGKTSQALLRIPVVKHDLAPQPGLGDGERRARQWVSEVEYHLLREGQEQEEEWRPPLEGLRWPAGAKSGAGAHRKVQVSGQDSEQAGLRWAQGRDPYLRESQASCPKFRRGRD